MTLRFIVCFSRITPWTHRRQQSHNRSILPRSVACSLISVESYPCREVHCCPSVQQECGHIDVAIVGSDMQGGESTLEDRQEKTDTQRGAERSDTSLYFTHFNFHPLYLWSSQHAAVASSITGEQKLYWKQQKIGKSQDKKTKVSKVENIQVRNVAPIPTQVQNTLRQVTPMQEINHRNKNKQ